MKKDDVLDLLSRLNTVVVAFTFLLFIVLSLILAFCDIWDIMSQENIDFFAKIIYTDLIIFCLCLIIFAIEQARS